MDDHPNPPGKPKNPRNLLRWLALLLSAGLLAYVSQHPFARPNQPPKDIPPPDSRGEIIPPGIIVSESSHGMGAPAPTAAGMAPGDSMVAGYGGPSLEPRQDLVLLSRSLGNFLLLEKSAVTRPLSANGEWSKAVAGKRGDAAPWFSPSAPVWDSGGSLVDRWNHPIHFHALGGGKWEIRSAGPDGVPYSPDDLTESLPVK